LGSVIYGFFSSIFFLPWLLAGMATLFFSWGYDLGWNDGIHESFQSGVAAVGQGDFFFLSMEFVSTPILASLPLWVSDGSNLWLDIIGTSREGWNRWRPSGFFFFLLLFSIV
jgi:hypothetical protein